MLLKITERDWGNNRIRLSEDQMDYDLTRGNTSHVFVYGYPFHPVTGKWVRGEDVASWYLNNDPEYIHEIDGIYTILIIDIMREKAFIITDRYGIYTLFFYRDGDQIIISDKIAEIIPHIPDMRFNEQSIAEYLYFGFKLGTKTHIEGIKEFEGASIYTIGTDLNMTCEKYWELIGSGKKERIKDDEFIKIFNEHMKTAFKLENKIVIPLSGGLDTRTILSSFVAQNLNFECYTNGVKNAPDVRIATKICEHLDIKHTFFEIHDELIRNIPATFRQGAWNYNGLIPPYFFLDLEHFRVFNKDKLIISGGLGNEIWRGLLPEKIMDHMTEEVFVDKIMNLSAYSKNQFAGLYKDNDFMTIKENIRNSVKNELDTIKNVKTPLERFEIFVLRNWGSNWAGCGFKSAGKYVKIFSASLNKDLLPQIVLLNRNDRINGRIQKRIVSANNRYLTTVRLDTSDIRHGASIKNDPMAKIRNAQTLISTYSKATVNFIPKRLLKRNIFKTPYFTDYPNWLRDHHGSFILDTLDHSRMHTSELFNEYELENITNMYLKGENSLEPLLTRIVGLELWLEGISSRSMGNLYESKTANNHMIVDVKKRPYGDRTTGGHEQYAMKNWGIISKGEIVNDPEKGFFHKRCGCP